MIDEQVVKVMIEKVEKIVREKVKDEFNTAKPTDRKTVSKAIINELEAVISDED